MKRKNRIWLWVLLLLLAAIAAAVIWKWQTVRTVYAVLTTDEQTAVQELEAQSEKEQEILDRYEISVTPPTMEQRDKLLRGKLSAQELKEELGLVSGSEGTPEQTASPAAPGSPSQGAAAPAAPELPADPQAQAAAIVEECVRSLYALEVDMIELLGSFRTDALNEWTGLSDSERTSTRKMQIIMDGLDRCEALEAQTDAEVRAMLDACRSELSSLGASTDVIDELWDSYTEEKLVTKTYFLSQYT